jgi:trans-2,3-dihydro-3-hydroxyanthranilate isomerase
MAARTYRFIQLDVFSDRAFGGNQLAVLPHADDLTDVEMQAIAREMNYAESTFVVAATDPAAMCRVRIFTPAFELPFAGHPTVGTAVALAHEGRVPAPASGDSTRILLQLGVGTLPVDVRATPGAVPFAWMHQPVPTFEPWRGDVTLLAAALGLGAEDLDVPGLPIERGSAGTPFSFVPVRSLAAIGRAQARPDLLPLLAASDTGGAYLFSPETQAPDALAHARLFAPAVGVTEDAATGSAAGPLSAYLFRHGRFQLGTDGVAHGWIEQGIEMGRPSRLEVEVEGQPDAVRAVRVGGHAVVVAEGELLLG